MGIYDREISCAGQSRKRCCYKKIDYKKIELLSDCQVRIPSGMAIDLGAAAKGYLSQKIIDLCKEKKLLPVFFP